MVCSTPTCGEGVVYSTPTCGGEVVCSATNGRGEVVCSAQSREEEGDRENPLSCSPPICEGNKKKRSADHNNRDRQVLNTRESKYYHLCGWCNAQPKEHSQQSKHLCCAPTGTQCPDLSSFKLATGSLWQPEDAMSSDSDNLKVSSLLNFRNTSKKKKRRGTCTFPLVCNPKKVNFNHQMMARLNDSW